MSRRRLNIRTRQRGLVLVSSLLLLLVITILALAMFRGIVKDYFLICESYYDAIRSASRAQIEAIDMGRRGVHNEGSNILMERLKEKVTLDIDTARRLFTLICVLHWKG